jgi:hypothetical protein
MLDMPSAAYVSDLFFNLDHDDAKIYDTKRQFLGWDTREDDRTGTLVPHGARPHHEVGDPPTVEAILIDFYARV